MEASNSIIKKIPFALNIVRYFRKVAGVTPEELNYKFHTQRRDALINNYFQNNSSVRKLQIGCQSHPFTGWLNVDLAPKNAETVIMDATKSFPFPDESFDYVFSEHMIEHIPFKDGLFMFKECFRVLKKGGKMRIVTPNLEFLIALYNKEKTSVQTNYIEFSKRYFSADVPVSDAVVINNFFRDWGHQFIYDEKTLKYSVEKVGFALFRKGEVNKSEDKNFCDLEKHGLEITDEFNVLESIVIEATKPV